MVQCLKLWEVKGIKVSWLLEVGHHKLMLSFIIQNQMHFRTYEIKNDEKEYYFLCVYGINYDNLMRFK